MKNESNGIHDSKSATRNQILKASQEIFEKYGYKKTTIDDIAGELHKGKSSIYYYFISKEDIFRAVLDKEACELKEEILAAIGRTNNPKEQITSYIEVRINAIKKLGNLFDFQKKQYLSLENAKELRAKYETIEIEVIKSILDEGVRQGIFTIRNTYMTALSIMTIIKGLEAPILMEAEETIKERLEEMLPILFNGISAVAK
ncbi:MAG TPA: TetR family transcriptional regulator [Marinilabiliales bacterium]|nr:MAG: hypothetical protein A2W95_07295 [Bacteroidetes bacterium GWA2_40_14]OFX60677.1 MAG: hypothetical protein A2W84_06445 [Bacteroidetes bacterium GWC2_40_13]OFX74577.1 MAG: hypothetical protein A2W96_10835 [Bacteroidetes bacterium GWD2_40_43]OFX89298.1 MAG: hypothetical protein A2W97_13525 [Bacteroidetes bacterium GWE2_40_63]OFY23922.1 MAG: hypothetical protein A2W88_12105 [Bacteroidetes bacterium GWF2_40_13]OFZ32296.1 MAG: hypothetical protein A2437_20025 [Bacteroidetes bacterium RIFOXYC